MTFLWGITLMGGLVGLNGWMTWRIIQAPVRHLPHKRVVFVGIWLMPLLGAAIARNHLRAYVPGETHRHKMSRWQHRVVSDVAPVHLALENAPPFDIARHLQRTDGWPVLPREPVHRWLAAISDEATRGQARDALRQAWLLHCRDFLGGSFRVHRSEALLMLSSADACIDEANADAALAIRRRAKTWLGALGINAAARCIVVFLDEERVRQCLPTAMSTRVMRLAENNGLLPGHAFDCLVTSEVTLRSFQAVLMRDLIFEALAESSMPAWLKHGLAEQGAFELADAQAPPWIGPDMRGTFWDEEQIQAFWSGEAFEAGDNATDLAVDLARMMVDHLRGTSAAFRQFVAEASVLDAGADAARELLELDLGACACVLLGHEPIMSWAPRSFSVV